MTLNIDRLAKLHILDSIETGLDNEPLTNDKDRIIYLKQRFESEYEWSVEIVGRPRAMRDWLQGLALNIEFNNYDILQLAKQWGSLPIESTEAQENKILDNYWRLMATKTLQLIDGYRVPKR